MTQVATILTRAVLEGIEPARYKRRYKRPETALKPA